MTDPSERHNVADARPELVRRFERDVRRWSAAQQERRVDATRADLESIDAALLERLRALGYLE